MNMKPRAPRVRLSPLHRVVFQRKENGRVMTLRLANISRVGMGLIRQNIFGERGDVFSGELQINDRFFAVDAEIKQASNNVVGCEFVQGATSELTAAVNGYFKVEICGLELKPVAKKFLKADPNGEVFWLTDGGTNEIYLVRDESGIHNFHVSFLGHYIEGGRTTPLQAGHVVEEFDTDVRGLKPSSLLDVTRAIDSEVLFLGTLLIENADELSLEVKNQLLSCLRD
jgi:hypothetical protein